MRILLPWCWSAARRQTASRVCLTPTARNVRLHAHRAVVSAALDDDAQVIHKPRPFQPDRAGVRRCDHLPAWGFQDPVASRRIQFRCGARVASQYLDRAAPKAVRRQWPKFEAMPGACASPSAEHRAP